MSGDAERFARLWCAASAPVARALGRRSDPAALDDALQEAALVAWTRFADFDGSRPFAAWVHGIARRQLAAQRRAQRRRREVPVEGCTLVAPARAAADEAAPVLGDLGDDDRRLLAWRYADGLDTAGIARRLQATPACVATRLHRLRARLRQRLAG